jgi:hypothetical protein
MVEKLLSATGITAGIMAYRELPRTANGMLRLPGSAGADHGGAATARTPRKRTENMGRLIRILLIVIVLAAIGLVGYSYSGFMQPERQTVTQPVDLGGD